MYTIESLINVHMYLPMCTFNISMVYIRLHMCTYDFLMYKQGASAKTWRSKFYQYKNIFKIDLKLKIIHFKMFQFLTLF